jgi:hypothetical protein
MNLPTFSTYGNYSSENYGAHALRFSVGSSEIYFSYKTPVAFFTPETGLVCRVNDWSTTTGKHLNAIEPDKKKRIPGDKFESLLAKHFK